MHRNRISVLLIDDNLAIVHLYKRNLERLGAFKITLSTDSEEAFRLTQKQLFDVVVIDAKIYYRGLELGGLKLADDLKNRYGCNSILIISRFITLDLMREHGSYFEFLDKGSGDRPDAFLKTLSAKITRLYKKQFIFVAMPFSSNFTPLYKNFKRVAKETNFKCTRGDEIIHGKNIDETLFEHIGKSKVVIFVASDANPNAYFEAGFACALNKEVIITAANTEDLPFDLKHKQAIFYGDNGDFVADLKKRINSLRFDKPLI